MLSFRKRTALSDVDLDADPLKIRNLLDSPQLRAVMGGSEAQPFPPPIPLVAHRQVAPGGIRWDSGHRELGAA